MRLFLLQNSKYQYIFKKNAEVLVHDSVNSSWKPEVSASSSTSSCDTLFSWMKKAGINILALFAQDSTVLTLCLLDVNFVVSISRCVCNIDCSGYSFNPVCASDGSSYNNPCFVREASCLRQEQIDIRHLGHCSGRFNFISPTNVNSDMNRLGKAFSFLIRTG